MSDKPEGLECDHCGDTAIDFHPPRHPGGRWLLDDGEGGRCESCGFPGRVSVDDAGDEADNLATWSINDWDEEAKCARFDCEECYPPEASR